MHLFYQWDKQFLKFRWACMAGQSTSHSNSWTSSGRDQPKSMPWHLAASLRCTSVSHDNLWKRWKSEWYYKPGFNVRDLTLPDNFGEHGAGSCVMPLALEQLVSVLHEGGTNVCTRHFGAKTLNREMGKSQNYDSVSGSYSIWRFRLITRAQISTASLFWGALNFNVSADMGTTRTSEVPSALKIN